MAVSVFSIGKRSVSFWMSLELRQHGKRAKSDRFIQVISDASKSTVDGIRVFVAEI
jgi:hypothetical protein